MKELIIALAILGGIATIAVAADHESPPPWDLVELTPTPRGDTQP